MFEKTDRTAIFNYSYTRGTALLVYGLIWLALTVAGYILLDTLFTGNIGVAPNLIFAVGAAMLAGGVGGVTALLTNLSRHIMVERNLSSQSIIYYAALPVLGLGLGLVSLLLISIPGQLIINFVTTGQFLFEATFATSTFTALQMVIAWIAGFYQQQGIGQIKTFLKIDTSTISTDNSINLNDPLAYKLWYRYRLRVIRWSYSWGLLAFGYNVIWLLLLLASFALLGQTALLNPTATTADSTVTVVLAAWPAVVAGALGGIVAALNRLYRSVSHTQDFHRQDLMFYLVQPPVGAIFGGVIYFLVTGGYFGINGLFSPGAQPTTVDSPTVVLIQMALGWLVGFRQEAVSSLTLKLITDVVKFFKTAARLLNPRIWFKQAERDQIWAELSRHNAVFRSIHSEPVEARSVWSDLPTDLN